MVDAADDCCRDDELLELELELYDELDSDEKADASVEDVVESSAACFLIAIACSLTFSISPEHGVLLQKSVTSSATFRTSLAYSLISLVLHLRLHSTATLRFSASEAFFFS